MNNIGNIGVNLGFWFWALVVVASVAIWWFVVMGPLLALLKEMKENIEKLVSDDPGPLYKDSYFHKKTAWLAVRAGVLVTVMIGLYVAFGPGRQSPPPAPEEEGRYQMNEAMPDEKPPEVLEQEAEDKRPATLKRVREPGFKQEQEEADEYLNNALRRAKEREGK